MPNLFSILMLSLICSIQCLALDLGRYQHLDPKKQVPQQALLEALQIFEDLGPNVTNPNFITIVDFSAAKSQKRFFIIDMKTGLVETLLTSHGSGSARSGKDADYAVLFSNIPGSKMSSLGPYLTTNETYYGKYGKSLRLIGLGPQNDQAYHRIIVVHGAEYINEDHPQETGTSEGCFALDQKLVKTVIQKIQNGSLIYAWIDSLSNLPQN